MKTSLKILRKFWKHENFRVPQEEIIDEVLAHNDTLAILPTGAGKSVCYQIPAIAIEGMCLVVTPLVSLMTDQVNQLLKKGIPAAMIHSGQHFKENELLLNNCIDGKYKFLYVSPERLSSSAFIDAARKMKVTLLAVDEAHCISEWGYDFRPHYLKIASIKSIYPNITTIALTATATKLVIKDIAEKLALKNVKIFEKSFFRPNISLSVFEVEDKVKKLLQILHNVDGSSIIYTRNRKDTIELSKKLYANGIKSDYYHAGLDTKQKDKKLADWQNNKIRVMVATNAFGMGINKPDVRTVIHYQIPETIESYYQEAGRAGRDNNKSFAVLLVDPLDLRLLKEKIEINFPEVSLIKRVYQALANYYKIAVGSSMLESYDFDIHHFCQTYTLPIHETYQCIKRLENEGLVALNESFFHPSKILICVDKLQLYDYQLRNKGAEEIISALLRIYGGDLFTTFGIIFESQIAQLIHHSETYISSQLQLLHKNGIIIYDPKKDKPNITFLTQRYDSNKLPFNEKNYFQLKNNFAEKISSISHYATNKEKCRAKLISEYFDELLREDCGICDNCLALKKKNREVSPNIYNDLIKLLNSTPLTFDEIKIRLSQYHENDLAGEITKLIEAEELYENENIIYLKS